MATVAPPAPDTSTAVPLTDPSGDGPWVLAGVAAGLARRLGASAQFIRVMLVMTGWFWFWPVIAVYTAAALLVPHTGRRRPGWRNLVGLSRILVLLVAVECISVALSFDTSGPFGEGPAVWIPFCGTLLAGIVALFTSGRSAAGYDEERCRRMVIGWVPAVVLTVAIAVGMLIIPGVRWELFLELGLIALGVSLAVAGTRGRGAAAIVPAGVLALVAILLASSGARLQGGIGSRDARPRSLVSVRHEYRRAIGDLTLDLSGLPVTGGTVTVAASVGIGDLTIELPNNAEGTVSVRVGAGGLAVASTPPNAVRSGFDLHRVVPIYPPRYPGRPSSRLLHLRLSAAVGRGCVTIEQVPGESISDGNGCL